MRSVFYEKWQECGAVFFEYGGWELPLHFGSGPQEHLRVREAGGVHDSSYQGVLRIAGKDAADFLNRISTVDVKKQPVNEWRAGLLLDVQGKVLSLFRLLRLQDGFLMLTQIGLAPASAEHLEKYHISEDLEIVDETGRWAILGAHGPKAQEALRAVGVEPGVDPASTAVQTMDMNGAQALVVGTRRTGEAGFEFIVPAERAEALWQGLRGDELLAALPPFGLDAENTLRFEAGSLNYGMEVDSSIIPLEAGLDDWVPQNQGCYLGQEVIERIRTHKNVPKLLRGFVVDGDQLPPPGSPIHAADKQVGVLVNSMYSPSRQRIFAVGYIRRQALDEHQELSVPGFTLHPAPLPFLSTACK